jgi:hypothetical protein
VPSLEAIEINGSGDVTSTVVGETLTMSISGSGDAELHVTGTLQVDISGSGSVTHRGGAEVDADISGSGDVEADD